MDFVSLSHLSIQVSKGLKNNLAKGRLISPWLRKDLCISKELGWPLLLWVLVPLFPGNFTFVVLYTFYSFHFSMDHEMLTNLFITNNYK